MNLKSVVASKNFRLAKAVSRIEPLFFHRVIWTRAEQKITLWKHCFIFAMKMILFFASKGAPRREEGICRSYLDTLNEIKKNYWSISIWSLIYDQVFPLSREKYEFHFVYHMSREVYWSRLRYELTTTTHTRAIRYDDREPNQHANVFHAPS